jgi:signal transduction histidine kinase
MMGMRAWSIIAWGLLCLAMPRGGWAEVSITGVSVDGRSLPITQEAASGADEGTVRITSTTRQITFAFEVEADAAAAASAGALPPDALPPPRGTRLRFRLDGHDRDWRDRPAQGRVILRFVDADGQTVGSDETALPGETAGWQGVAETSPLSPSSFSAVAPPLATRAVVNFISGYEQVVGAMGFDDVMIAVTPPRGAAVEHAFPFTGLGDTPHPLATPAGWGRSGSRGELSRIAMQSTAGGQPILTILDDDPRHYGSWSLSEGVVVQPGDTVAVSWRASHSFGAGGSLEASYNGLSPGEYRFRVSACLPGCQPTGEEASLRVIVIPPWYRRGDVWLAIGLSAVAGAALAARQISLRRLRRRLEAVEQAHALERERARIARDLHDEVGAGLTEIAMQTAWLQRDIEATAPPETLLRASKACQAAIDLTRSVDAIVWAVNPANDTLDRFVSYLTQATEQFTDAAGLAVRFDVPAQIPTMPIPGTVRHGLFLIVREALNNAVKHARCHLIRLGVRLADASLTITVEDDGRGVLPPDPDHRGLGLESMQQRATDLGGTLEVAPQPGGGTCVTVTIPMPANTES